ncbi:Ribosomal large subunit pseudouridine synthase D [hydrothermal vent metagenome]|uniref:Ribosomal large subunit pseudouridine synthase D n=1 Tax=hydrothermal vent metagenome TaxID=652676 RepID=A0A3B1DFW7_9ZZZZ
METPQPSLPDDVSSGDAPEEPLEGKPGEQFQRIVEARAHGWRIDHYLCRLFPNFSRAQFQRSIASEQIFINGLSTKPGRRVRVNDCVDITLPDEPTHSLPPEDIPLDIIFEDEHLVVVNKPAGMVVHPGKGNYGGTLAGALQHHFDELSNLAGAFRPGIVHRLDRDTTGLMIVAKNNQVHHRLSRQFELREVNKTYRALVWKEVNFDSDWIETYVKVHPKVREKMTVCSQGGAAREATTFYEVLERFDGFTYVQLKPKTGRTHQLRIHMQHLGHPMLADKMYGGHSLVRLSQLQNMMDPQANATPQEGDVLINRQALHAYQLEFTHPESNEKLSFQAELPKDFKRTLTALQEVVGKK